MADGAVPTVLVVDDDDSIREITQIALELVGGWQVLPASGGEEAVRIAREQRPDAVLLDVMMPGMDGPSTFQHLRDDAATRDIPVVFLTAKIRGDAHEAWAGLAVAGVISKPFDPMSLATEMAALLGW
ncbi:response regulator [Nocardioides pantholopis]|uniref:response regulator n=1 Tax=Nocardioides pantholopis TaxID=2483798 RepID=UPI001F14A218|nr:response regulator [Nocardioides pantholopis]